MELQQKVFRYTFSDNMITLLNDFALTHKYEDKIIFKESWNLWKQQNEDAIQRELNRLSDIGYNGDIYDKMYKSVRYYYSKKQNVDKNDKKQRRKYIGISREILNLIDQTIREIVENDIDDNIIDKNEKKPQKTIKIKPSEMYHTFLDKYGDNQLKNEIQRLNEEIDNENEVILKIKKTFKNRYFNYFR